MDADMIASGELDEAAAVANQPIGRLGLSATRRTRRRGRRVADDVFASAEASIIDHSRLPW
jgi:hypothetical protein